MELGGEDYPAGITDAVHSIRKLIPIKLSDGVKDELAGHIRLRKAKVESAQDSAAQRDQAGLINDDDAHFGENCCVDFECLVIFDE